jgi:integrase
MSLSLHVFRRGAVYWWRRRITGMNDEICVGSRPRLVALSLKTHDPKTARHIAATLSARVMAAELSGEWRMLNDEQMRRIIRDKIREYSEVYARTRVVERGGPMKLDPQAGAQEDLQYAWAMQILSEQGVLSASVTERDKQRMREQGLHDEDHKAVAAILRTHFSGAATPSTISGREHAKRNFLSEPMSAYREILIKAGVKPSPLAIAEVERLGYLAQAAALRESASIRVASLGEMAMAETIAREVIQGREHIEVIPKSLISSSNFASGGVTPTAIQEAISPPIAAPVTSMGNETTVESSPVSIIDMVNNYATERERLGEISDKTSKQYAQVARLLVKVLKVDDARLVTATTVNNYRDYLGKLPKNYGKSPSDIDLSIEQLVARTKKLSANEIGMSGPTINRHITQLTAILDIIERRVSKIKDRPEGRSLRTKKPKDQRNRDKRIALSEPALTTLFSLPVWTGHNDHRSRLQPGPMIIHDALYWVPILGYYLGARRGEICGLKLDEVISDHAVPHVLICTNEIRRLKTASSEREIPLHPEILRLGFLDYVSEMKRKKHSLLFPELKIRAPNTDMGDTFYGDFKNLLAHAQIPPEWGKDFHGMRHRMLGSLKQAGVTSEVRGDVAGHRGRSVTEEDYGEDLYLPHMLETIKKLPIFTKKIKIEQVRYSYWLLRV